MVYKVVCFHWDLQLKLLDGSRIHHPIQSWVAHTNTHRLLGESQVPCTHCVCHFLLTTSWPCHPLPLTALAALPQ